MIPSNLLCARNLGLLLMSVPAMLCGCSGGLFPEEAHVTMNKIINFSSEILHATEGSPLDIFAFEDDIFQRLDSYQRIETFTGSDVAISSTGGEKIFFICSDGQRTRYEWSEVTSYYTLRHISCDLESETQAKRTMTGECSTRAGDMNATVRLRPLSCEVILDAISCDFSGTPYSGAVIEDVKAYLTNVNATYPILPDDDSDPARIINAGMLAMTDVRSFTDTSIILQEVASELGEGRIYPHLRYLCYPNASSEESPGSPSTRLVIEGRIGEDTYYWPVTVNEGIGLERGCRYVFDILIRRKGVTDPDIPVSPTHINIEMKTKAWNEKEDYIIGF